MELLSATDVQFGTFPALQVWKGSNLVWNRGFYWTGLGIDNNWTTANNWNGSKAPVANSPLTFGGTNRLSAFNNFTTDTPFASISFDSTASQFQLSGNRLTIGTGGFINNSSTLQTINNDIKLNPSGNTIKAVGDMSFSGVLSGVGFITKSGNGTVTLRGANTYTGKTIVSQGTLNTSTANRISDASAIEVLSGAMFSIDGSETVASLEGAGTISIGGNNLTVSSANTATFVGLLSSTTGTFTKSGTGTQTLSTGNLGGVLTHTGGTLNISGNFTTSKDFTLCQGTAAAPANANFTGTITQTNQGPQAAPRSFTVAQNANNVGTLTISGANVTLYGGLMIGDNRSTGSNGTIILNSGALSANGSVWFSGPTASIIVDGGTHAFAQMYISGGGHATDNPTPVSVFTLNNGVVDITGPWTGSAYNTNQALLLFGSSTVGISSTSTINLNGGSLKLNQVTGNTPAIGNTHTNTINFNGGTFDYDKGTDRNLPAVTPAGVTWNLIIKNGGAKISVYSGRTLAMAVPFSNDGGSGGLTKLGPGTLALGSFAHTYTGTTDISAGTVTVAKTTGAVTATATFTNTTLTVSFNTPPSIGDAFKFFPGSTTQTYASVSLIGAPGRTANYSSLTSTLSVIS